MSASAKEADVAWHPGRIAGGLAASWVMNVFMSSLGGKITDSLMSDEDKAQQQLKQQEQEQNAGPEEDATMKAAEGIVHAVTRGQHLSHGERKQAGPVVHYAFGALVGGLYGAHGGILGLDERGLRNRLWHTSLRRQRT